MSGNLSVMNCSLSATEDVAARLERKNRIAVQHGLPEMGSRVTNKYGIEWVVDGHLFAPDLASYVRDTRDGAILREEDPRDLFPSVIPQNISPRLEDFLAETDHCTSKHLMFLDTVPWLRPRQAKNDLHCVSFAKDPDRYLYYLDIANVDETILAHETAHLWVDLVEGREDYRVMRPWSEPDKMYQCDFVSSFVSDLWVNDIIRARGFDTSRLEWQEKQAILKYAEGVAKGASRNNRREDAFWALALASLFVQRDRDFVKGDGALTSAMSLLETCRSDIYALAKRLAVTVEKYGYTGHESNEAARIECLQHSFDFTGDIFDPDVDLVHKKILQPDIDKSPEFFSGLSVPAKLEIRRAMVKHGTANIAQMALVCGPTGLAQIEFIDSVGNCTYAFALKDAVRFPAYYSPLPEPFSFGGQLPFNPRMSLNNGMQRPPMPQLAGRAPFGPQVPPAYGMQPAQIPQSPKVPPMPTMMQPQPPIMPQLPSHLPELRTLPQLPIIGLNDVPPNASQIPPAWTGGFAPDVMTRNYMPGLALSLAEVRLDEVNLVDVNLYRYAGNNPVNRIDPTGLFSVDSSQGGSCPPQPEPMGMWPNSKPFGLAYGNCCGPLRRCFEHRDNAGNVTFGSPVIDSIDAACRRHDQCLATWREVLSWTTQRHCNLQLCYDAIAAYKRGCRNAKGSSNAKQCKAAAFQVATYFCRGINNLKDL